MDYLPGLSEISLFDKNRDDQILNGIQSHGILLCMVREKLFSYPKILA